MADISSRTGMPIHTDRRNSRSFEPLWDGADGKKTMKIQTSEEYRAAVEEAQQLESAREGTPEFKRLQELVTAMHEYELDHLVDPKYRPGRPAGSI